MEENLIKVNFSVTKLPKHFMSPSCSGCVDDLNNETKCKRYCKDFDLYSNETKLIVVYSDEKPTIKNNWENTDEIELKYYFNDLENVIRLGEPVQHYHHHVLATFPKVKNLPLLSKEFVNKFIEYRKVKKDFDLLLSINDKKELELDKIGCVEAIIEDLLSEHIFYKKFNSLYEIYNAIQFIDNKTYLLKRLEKTINLGNTLL